MLHVHNDRKKQKGEAGVEVFPWRPSLDENCHVTMKKKKEKKRKTHSARSKHYKHANMGIKSQFKTKRNKFKKKKNPAAENKTLL